MPEPFARRSIFSGEGARPAGFPEGAVPAHSNFLPGAAVRTVGFGTTYCGEKQKCTGTAKHGGRCGAWAVPGAERCAGHAE